MSPARLLRALGAVWRLRWEPPGVEPEEWAKETKDFYKDLLITSLILIGAVVQTYCVVRICDQLLFWEPGVALVTKSEVEPAKEGKGTWTLRLRTESGAPARLNFGHDGSERHDLDEAQTLRDRYLPGSELAVWVDPHTPSRGGVVNRLDRPGWLRFLTAFVLLFGVVYADSFGSLVTGHLRGIEAVHGVEPREPRLVSLLGPETTCAGLALAIILAALSALQGWPGLLATVVGTAFPAWISFRVLGALDFWRTWRRLAPRYGADWDEALEGPVEVEFEDEGHGPTETRALGVLAIEESRLLDSQRDWDLRSSQEFLGALTTFSVDHETYTATIQLPPDAPTPYLDELSARNSRRGYYLLLERRGSVARVRLPLEAPPPEAPPLSRGANWGAVDLPNHAVFLRLGSGLSPSLVLLALLALPLVAISTYWGSLGKWTAVGVSAGLVGFALAILLVDMAFRRQTRGVLARLGPSRAADPGPDESYVRYHALASFWIVTYRHPGPLLRPDQRWLGRIVWLWQVGLTLLLGCWAPGGPAATREALRQLFAGGHEIPALAIVDAIEQGLPCTAGRTVEADLVDGFLPEVGSW